MDARVGMLARLYEHSIGLGWSGRSQTAGSSGPTRDQSDYTRGSRGCPARPWPARRAGVAAASTTPASAPGATSTSGSTRRSSTAPCPAPTTRARPQDRPHAPGGAPELALHRPLRGAGPPDDDVRGDRCGHNEAGSRVGLTRLGDAWRGRGGGEDACRLLGCDPRRRRRHDPRSRAALHIRDGQPGRQAGRRGH